MSAARFLERTLTDHPVHHKSIRLSLRRRLTSGHDCGHCNLRQHLQTSRRVPVREPLENGDHLTAREFLRRYETMPQVKKAELSKGSSIWVHLFVMRSMPNPIVWSRPG